MARKHPKRPTDLSQAAKFVIDVATGQTEDSEPAKNPAAVALGRRGGLRAAKPERQNYPPKSGLKSPVRRRKHAGKNNFIYSIDFPSSRRYMIPRNERTELSYACFYS